MPIGFEARDNGALIRFNQAVQDADAATCFAQCWNYRYSAAYGSPEYSVKFSDTPGHDPLEIRSVQKLDGGKTLFLEIPQIVTASQIHLRVSTGHDLFLTAHALAEPFTDFPGYTPIAKTNPAAQIGLTAPREKGDYPYLCTFPGHWMIMNGVLSVE